MKLKSPRRRWLVLAGCLAGVICGPLIMYGVDAQRRYQRILASYDRVRIGMSISEVRAAIGQPSVVVPPAPPPFIDEDRRRATDGDQGVMAKAPKMSEEIWVDHDLTIDVWYADGKALDKSLNKRSIAKYWFDRLLRLYSSNRLLRLSSSTLWILSFVLTFMGMAAIVRRRVRLTRRKTWTGWRAFVIGLISIVISLVVIGLEIIVLGCNSPLYLLNWFG